MIAISILLSNFQLVEIHGNQRVICIDPGHQSSGNYSHEPIGPGSSSTKPKVSSGTRGVKTGKPEYVLVLEISNILKEKLESRGYKVIMTRDSHDVDISNKERADIANNSQSDLFLRIHADGSENKNVTGISTLYPSPKNQYVSHLSKDSERIARLLVDEMSQITGAKNRGIIPRDDMSGINWSKVPVVIIENGFMTNPDEDVKLSSREYQEKLAEGMVIAIDKYFGLDSKNEEIVEEKNIQKEVLQEKNIKSPFFRIRHNSIFNLLIF